MEHISLLCPTRKRPLEIARMLTSAFSTASRPDLLEAILYTDWDDTLTAPALQEVRASNTPILQIIGPRIVLSECWNRAYALSTGDILHHCGDDIIWRTPDWDNIVRAEFARFPDRIAFVFGNDGGHPPGTFGTHGFIHRRWAQALGYFVPPYFSSDYNDTWLNDVARLIDRWRYAPILTEHMHFCFGKGPLDETHKERLERGERDNVKALYESLAEQRNADASKLRALMS